MATSTQSVSLLLELKDKVSAGLNRVAGGLDKLGGLGRAVSGAFSGMGAIGGAAMVGLGAAAFQAVNAVRELAQEGIDLNRTFENTSIRIAGTLKAFDVAPSFAKAKAQAADVMGTVAELAAKLPGETEDYVSVFATALPKAIAAGMTDMQEVAKFTSYWTAVATSNMVDAQQAGMDLFRVLAGQAGADVRMWTVLSEKIGMTAEAFNKLAAPERLARIQAAIGAFDAQLIAAGDTYDAKAGEFESRLKEIKRVGTELSFDMAKRSLDEMNQTLKENRGELTATVDSLTGAFTFYKEGAKGLLVDIGTVTAKMLNSLVLTNTELAKIRGQGALEAAKPTGLSDVELAEKARAARIQEYEEREYAKIESLLPEQMQRGLGPMGLATSKVYNELIRIGKQARKTDPFLQTKIADYFEFMRVGDPELAYFKMTGLRPEGTKKIEKREITKAPVTNFYNSRFDIKQNFAEGFDPDRIAVAFAADLGRMGEMKTQSSYVQSATVR